MDTFSHLVELPKITDTALLALAENRSNAVAALARALRRAEDKKRILVGVEFLG